MVSGKKLVYDAALIFVIGILASAIGYLIRVVLSRQLSLQEFGVFYAVFTFITFFSIFRDFGLSQSLPKFIPQFMIKKEYSNVSSSIKFIFLVNFLISSTIFIIILFLSNYLSINYFKSELAKPLLIILGIYFIFHSIYSVFISTFVGFQKSKLYSLDIFLINVFVFVGIFIFYKLGVLSPAISYLLATLFGIIIFSIFLFKSFEFPEYKEKISRKLKFDLLKYGFPLMFATMGFIIIAQIDTLILIYFRSLEEVGIYNVVLPTAMLLITLGSSLALAILPLISEVWAVKKYKEVKNLIKKIYERAFILIVPVGFILFIFSSLVLDILFGTDFVVGSSALKVLSLGGIFFSFAVINNNILAATGNPKKVTKIIMIAAFINIILNIALIPPYGIKGAALATTVSYLSVLILSTYFVTKIIKISVPVGNWMKIFLSGLFFIFVIDFLRKILVLDVWLEVFITLILGLIVYLLSLLILGIKLNFLKQIDI